MKFRAKLAPEQASLLYQLIGPISRIASSSSNDQLHTASASSWMKNSCMLYLDEMVMRLSAKGKMTDTDGIACFAELQAGGGIFFEHRIESNATNNAIVMELDLVQMRTALQSIQQDRSSLFQADTFLSHEVSLEHQYTVLKLAKRNNIPCLCLDAYTSSASNGGMVKVHHAIPVRVCRVAEMQYHFPPQVSLPDVQLELMHENGNKQPLRTIVERLRPIASTVLLKGNMKTGDLTLSVDTDGASIRTFFHRLIPRPDACKENTTNICEVKIETKKLTSCLQWQQNTNLASSALLCLVENEVVVLHVTLSPRSVGFFTYYVPVHFLSSDPCED
jgi:hypothetical protein